MSVKCEKSIQMPPLGVRCGPGRALACWPSVVSGRCQTPGVRRSVKKKKNQQGSGLRSERARQARTHIPHPGRQYTTAEFFLHPLPTETEGNDPPRLSDRLQPRPTSWGLVQVTQGRKTQTQRFLEIFVTRSKIKIPSSLRQTTVDCRR